MLLTREEKPAYEPCTNEDPRCQETLRKLRERGEWMAKTGIPRLLGKGTKFTSAAQTDIGKTFDSIRRLKTGVARRIK